MAMFTNGQTIDSKAGNVYEIVGLLGEGITAEVYRARRTIVKGGGAPGDPVALKVLRPGLPEEIEQHFRDEVDTLSKVRGEAERRDPRVVELVPGTIEDASRKELAQTRFIAFEFIAAPSVDQLLSDNVPLDEQHALTIASQVLSILDVLHVGLRKSYTDFQLQNIRWDDARQQVKVIDWNHLSLAAKEGETPPGAVDDLARMGAYLYQMLTGAGARLSGETLRLLEQRGGEAWTRLSLGTRLIIARALHLNPNRRYQTAADFRQAIDDQLALWTKELKDLKFDVTVAVGPIDAASSQGGRANTQDIENAQVVVDMLERRESDAYQAEHGRALLDQVLGEISPAWAAGVQDYQRGAYQQAAATWDEEAQAIGRVALRRWVMAAQTAAHLGRETYDTQPVRGAIERGLEALAGEKWPEAVKELRAAAGRHNVAPLNSLLAEAEAHDLYKQARDAETLGNWRNAHDAYTRLLRRLPDITYGDAVAEEFGWDEKTLQRAADRSAANAGADANAQTQRRQVEAALARNFEEGLNLLVKELQQQPDNPALLALADGAGARPPEEALRLLDAIRRWASLSPAAAQQLRQQWQAAHERRLAELAAAAVRQRDVHSAAAYLADLRSAPPPALQSDLDQWYTTAVRAGALPVAASLAGVLGRWDKPFDAQQREADLRRLRQAAATDGEQWQGALFKRIQQLVDSGDTPKAVEVIDSAAAYFKDDTAFQARLDALRPQAELARQLAVADARLNGTPDAVDVAFARDSLARAEQLLPTLTDTATHTRQSQTLNQLQARAGRIEARLAGERYLTSAEAWLKHSPPRFDAAAADAAAAESHLANLNDPTLSRRLDLVKRQLDGREQVDFNYLFRYWLTQTEHALNQDNPRVAAPMLTLADGYRRSLSATTPELKEYDQRLVHLRERLAKMQAKEVPASPDDGVTPVVVVPPPLSPLDQALKWLPLALSALALLLLALLLLGIGRPPAAVRTLPDEVVALQGDVRGVQQTLGALVAAQVTATAATTLPTPAPTTPPTPAPTAVITPTQSAATPTVAATATPAPLGLTTEFTSLPVPEGDATTFFDLPNMRLTAPAGWQFDLTQPTILLIDDQQDRWQLYYTIASGADAVGQDQFIDRSLVNPADGATAGQIEIVWANAGASAPQPAGGYLLSFKATHTRISEQRLLPPVLITIKEPARVTLIAGGELRTTPQWTQTAHADASFPPDQAYELLGQTSAPCTSGCNWAGADQALMLLVRPLGQRQTYWVGDHDTNQFGSGELTPMLAGLPQIP